ncbi:DUF5668 domain-containing protein [soil metagenome]
MDTNDSLNKHGNENRLWTGILLVLGGLVYLAYQMGAPFPTWLLSWHTGLIACGIFIGIKNRFQNNSWLILILVGGIFLLDDLLPGIELHDYIVPIVIIGAGLVFILRPTYRRSERKRDRWTSKHMEPIPPLSDNSSDAEYIDDSSFLGSMNKVILSKNFKGGEINCVLGGAQIDLSQADIQQQAVLEINQVFGGTKIIVPANWNVKIEVTAVLGAVEDKRNVQSTLVDTNKVLILKGNTVFGGIEIKNY